MVTQPRGIRNNNPGNLRKNDSDKWQGLADAQDDPSFFVFKDPTYGIRALARTLVAYQDQHDLHTTRQFITRWAPATENDTGAYVNAVAVDGLPDAPRDMHVYEDLKFMVVGIITHENGSNPYTAAQIDKGLTLAGVEPPKKSLLVSKQVLGSAVAAVATVAPPLIQQAQDTISPLIQYVDSLKYVFTGLVLLGLALTLWAKIDERRKGIS